MWIGDPWINDEAFGISGRGKYPAIGGEVGRDYLFKNHGGSWPAIPAGASF